MKKLFKRLRKIEKEIKDYKSQIKEVDTLHYYVIFPEGKERDRREMLIELKHLLDVKHAVLDTIQIAINKERVLISQKERSLTLKLNAE